MNNTFNIQRFGLLLKRQWLEFGKIYLITLGVALGVILTSYSFALFEVISEPSLFNERSIQGRLQFREPLFLIFGFLFTTVIASSYFAHLGQKPKAIIDLMIPASTFEKFLTGVFFTSILSTLSYILVFYIADLAFISKVKSISEVSAYFFTKNKPDEFESIYIAVPLFITSIFLLGSIYFNKFHYIKTAICTMIFSGIWAYIVFKTGETLFDGKVRIEEDTNMHDVSEGWVEVGVFAAFLLLTAIFWAITYVRLKEKEV